MILPETSYKVKAKFYTLLIIKNKFQSTIEKTGLPLHSLYEKYDKATVWCRVDLKSM